MSKPNIFGIPPRIKLKKDKDGNLSYPHNFKVGDFISYRDKSYAKKFGIAIIVSIENQNVKLYFQMAENTCTVSEYTLSLVFKKV